MFRCSRRSPVELRKVEIERSLRRIGGLTEAQALLEEYERLRQMQGMPMLRMVSPHILLGASNLYTIEEFADSNWTDLIKSLGLLYGLNRDETNGFQRSTLPLWSLKSGAVTVPYTIHNKEQKEVVTCSSKYYAEAVTSGFESFSNTTTLGTSSLLPASVSVSVGYSSETSTSSTTTSTTTSYYKVVQRVLMEADFAINASGDDTYEISSDFQSVLANAEALTNNLQKALVLWSSLDDFGYFHPTTIVAGGKLHMTKTSSSTSTTSDTSESKTSGISFEVSASAYGVEVGNSTTSSSTNSTSNATSSDTSNSSMSLKKEGGDTNLATETDWATSVNDATLWQPVRYQNVRHLTEALPSAYQTRVNAILKHKDVTKVFGDIHAWTKSQDIAEYFEGKTVLLARLDGTALGVPSLGELGGRCFFRNYGDDDPVAAVQWTVVEDSGAVQFVTNATNERAVLTASKDSANLTVEYDNGSSDPYQWWKFKQTNSGVYLLNVGTLTFLKAGTKATASLAMKSKPSLASDGDASWWVPNANSTIDGKKGSVKGGDWYTKGFDDNSDYSKFDEVFTSFLTLFTEWLGNFTDASKWVMLMETLRTKSIQVNMHCYETDYDNDTYENSYEINLAGYKGKLLDRSAVKEYLKQQYSSKASTWKSSVESTEGDINLSSISHRCKFPYPTASPSVGPYSCAEVGSSAEYLYPTTVSSTTFSNYVGAWGETITLSA